MGILKNIKSWVGRRKSERIHKKASKEIQKCIEPLKQNEPISKTLFRLKDVLTSQKSPHQNHEKTEAYDQKTNPIHKKILIKLWKKVQKWIYTLKQHDQDTPTFLQMKAVLEEEPAIREYILKKEPYTKKHQRKAKEASEKWVENLKKQQEDQELLLRIKENLEKKNAYFLRAQEGSFSTARWMVFFSLTLIGAGYGLVNEFYAIINNYLLSNPPSTIVFWGFTANWVQVSTVPAIGTFFVSLVLLSKKRTRTLFIISLIFL